MLRIGRSAVRMPAGTRDFSLLQNVQIGSGAHPPSIQWVPELFTRGGKRPGRDADNSRTYSVPRLRVSGAISPLPYMPERCAKGQTLTLLHFMCYIYVSLVLVTDALLKLMILNTGNFTCKNETVHFSKMCEDFDQTSN
jgi:hypothetical protein